MLGRFSAKEKDALVFQHHTNYSPDGFYWRKYDQKPIKDCNETRSYYRCGFAEDQNCKAKKWVVQKCEGNPLMSRTKYEGLHTCQAVVSLNLVNEELSSFNMVQFGSQDQTVVADTDTAVNHQF